jgi:hypothetical protein
MAPIWITIQSKMDRSACGIALREYLGLDSDARCKNRDSRAPAFNIRISIITFHGFLRADWNILHCAFKNRLPSRVRLHCPVKLALNRQVDRPSRFAEHVSPGSSVASPAQHDYRDWNGGPSSLRRQARGAPPFAWPTLQKVDIIGFSREGGLQRSLKARLIL